MAAEEDLLVEGDDEVGFVAPIGDGLGAKADAIAARSLGHSRGWLDLGRDDLHRPDPVPHLGGDCSEDLAAFLRPLSGVGDYFYSMLRPLEDGRCGAKLDRQGDGSHWRIRLFFGRGADIGILTGQVKVSVSDRGGSCQGFPLITAIADHRPYPKLSRS